MSTQGFRQAPHKVVASDLPPSFPQRIWRTGKKAAKATVGTAKKYRAEVVIFAALSIGATGGWTLGENIDPYRTSQQRLDAFVAAQSITLPKTTVSKVLG